MQNLMNLQQFHDKILKPSVIAHIKCGDVDSALTDPDCLEIILADPDLTEALKYRLDKLNE